MKAEAALKTGKASEEAEAIMRKKKTKKTGRGGKKLVSKFVSSWIGVKKESCAQRNLV